MNTCPKCGLKSSMPFHTCMNSPIEISPEAREAAKKFAKDEPDYLASTAEYYYGVIIQDAINSAKAELEKERDSLAKQLLVMRDVLQHNLRAYESNNWSAVKSNCDSAISLPPFEIEKRFVSRVILEAVLQLPISHRPWCCSAIRQGKCDCGVQATLSAVKQELEKGAE